MGDYAFFQQALGNPQLEYQLRKNALVAWTLAEAWTLVSATFNGASPDGTRIQIMDSAQIVWPNGVSGTYTLLVGSVYGGADSYSVTYVQDAFVTRTITAPAPTRDSLARVIAQPPLIYA